MCNEDICLVIIPHLGVNDDTAQLLEWYAEDEDSVSKGEAICVTETTKATFDIEAEVPGILVHLIEAPCEVFEGQIVGAVAPSAEKATAWRDKHLPKSSAEVSLGVRATNKARTLAGELGVDLSEIDAQGIIREADVRRKAKHLVTSSSGRANVVAAVEPGERGYLDAGFFDLISNDPSFPFLSSDLKIHLYRIHGAIIGEGVVFAPGSMILSKVIRLGKGAEIGDGATIKTERFVLGDMSVIGKNARVLTREVIVGDVLFSGENVTIGGGGGFGPRSFLHMGDNCLISSYCILNTGESITIGDEVGLSPYVRIFTHSHWQNVLKGYAARHAPVVIGDEVYITSNCLVAPGVRIGRGAMIQANSLVASNIEPFTIAAGVPAQKVSQINTDLSLVQKDRIMGRLMKEILEDLSMAGFEIDTILYSKQYDWIKRGPEKIVLAFGLINVPKEVNEIFLFDLEKQHVYGVPTRLSDEVRNQLRRRGIRFKPYLWRYGHDRGYFVQ